MGAALIFLYLFGVAEAVVFCANGRLAVPYASMMKHLGKRYGESPTHLGISGTDFIVLFNNKKKGTMTIISVTKGLACVVTAANEWHYNVPPRSLDPVF